MATAVAFAVTFAIAVRRSICNLRSAIRNCSAVHSTLRAVFLETAPAAAH